MEEKFLTREIVQQNGWDELEVITADMLDGYTEIGYAAFGNCYNITSITIPNSVTYIGNSAFAGCDSLTSVIVPNSVITIGASAFRGCSNLKSINIPDSTKEIGEYAFHRCKSLTSITIPDSVTRMESGAFDGCSSLTSVTIPNSVTYMGYWVFNHCSFKTPKRYDEQGRLIAYKGFNADMSCRGFQYEEGETYEMDGEIKLCERGFHACTNPLDCLNFYGGEICKDVVYHEVYLEDVSDESGDDSKVVARKITIGHEITLSEMADIASGKK